MSDLAGRVVDAFRERVGRDPDGVWAAPGRVNLIGEHTDYNDGFVLPAAIDRLVLVAAGRRDGGRLRLWSLQAGPPADLELAAVGPGRVEGWAAYPAGVAWALGQAGVELGGADLVVDGDVPAGSGLSSSAALECATATALADLHGAGLDRQALAGLARRAENEVVGVPSGAMDQMVSMLGRAGHALFLDTRSLETEQVPLPLEASGLCLVVIDTRAGHRLVDGAYADRKAACEAAAAVLGVPALRDATLEQVEAAAEAARATQGCAGPAMWSPRTPGCWRRWRCCGPASWTGWARCWPPRMPPCATTTRCPRPSSTPPSRRPWTPARPGPA